MTLFERIARRVPRGLAIMMAGFAGMFGMRTPPEPDVVPQRSPSRRREEDEAERSGGSLSVELPKRPEPGPDRTPGA